ncbi:SURF6 domain-containing protein [Trichoderma evansii]
MAESLQDRLRDHAKAFDGLLSLIPAKMYYGEDTSDQWQREKQTKQEAAAARRAKLDPDSALNRSAKEELEERAKSKRKLRQMEQEENGPEEEDYEPMVGVEAEKPLEGLKKQNPETPHKKSKTNGDAEAESDDEEEADGDADTANLSRREQKRAAKREKKAEKKAEKKTKQETGEPQTPAKTPAKPAAKTPVNDATEAAATPASKKQKNKKAAKETATPSKPQPTPSKSEESKVDDSDKADDRMEGLDTTLDFSGLQREDDGSAPDSEPHSPTFDSNEAANGQPTPAELASTTTSISSIAPSEKPKHIKIPADTEALRARLAAKIEALRAARKADGTNGKPVRTRQELIEQRRFKEAQRKAHKKELRKLAKDEEQRKREEALASNSPGVMSPNVSFDDTQGGFSFGRVAFADGTQMSHDLSYFLNRGKKKGPSDPKTALLKVQNEKKRIEELDTEKRKDIEEKESWLNARRRAQGEKVHDDEAMLKKAVKRKEANKKKSEKAWKERATGVAQAQHERQKKREENIKQRREDKLLKRSGKKKKKGSAGKSAGKKKGGRPGFEGSFGVGGKKK